MGRMSIRTFFNFLIKRLGGSLMFCNVVKLIIKKMVRIKKRRVTLMSKKMIEKAKASKILVGISSTTDLFNLIKKDPTRRDSLVKSYKIREKHIIKINKTNSHFMCLSHPLKTLAYHLCWDKIVKAA